MVLPLNRAIIFFSTHPVPAHLLLEQLQPLFRLLDLAIGHIFLNLIVDFLRGASPRRKLGRFGLDSALPLSVVGVLEVFGRFGGHLRLVEPALCGRLNVGCFFWVTMDLPLLGFFID